MNKTGFICGKPLEGKSFWKRRELATQNSYIHQNQDKENCYFGIGDEVEIILKDRVKDDEKVFKGIISTIDMRLQTGTEHDGIHPCIVLADTADINMVVGMFWLENIEKIKILQLN